MTQVHHDHDPRVGAQSRLGMSIGLGILWTLAPVGVQLAGGVELVAPYRVGALMNAWFFIAAAGYAVAFVAVTAFDVPVLPAMATGAAMFTLTIGILLRSFRDPDLAA